MQPELAPKHWHSLPEPKEEALQCPLGATPEPLWVLLLQPSVLPMPPLREVGLRPFSQRLCTLKRCEEGFAMVGVGVGAGYD